MTFKGMLKIVVNDFKKQHEEKLFSITNELLRTRRELVEVKEQLRNLQLGSTPPSNSDILERSPPSTISLFVQYNGFFNELCDIQQSMTINELLIKLRQIAGIDDEQLIHIRVLSEDGGQTLFFLDQNPSRTVESYNNELKPRMILSIEDDDDNNTQNNNNNELSVKRNCFQRSRTMTSSDRTHSYESDV